MIFVTDTNDRKHPISTTYGLEKLRCPHEYYLIVLFFWMKLTDIYFIYLSIFHIFDINISWYLKTDILNFVRYTVQGVFTRCRRAWSNESNTPHSLFSIPSHNLEHTSKHGCGGEVALYINSTSDYKTRPLLQYVCGKYFWVFIYWNVNFILQLIIWCPRGITDNASLL